MVFTTLLYTLLKINITLFQNIFKAENFFEKTKNVKHGNHAYYKNVLIPPILLVTKLIFLCKNINNTWGNHMTISHSFKCVYN